MAILVLYLTLAIVVALATAGWFYLFPLRKGKARSWWLFVLRALSVFLLVLLLLNPVLKKTTKTTVKPDLAVLLDNSLSIKIIKQDKNLRDALTKIRQRKLLQEKYNVKYYTIGNQLKVYQDSLTFNDLDTDFSEILNLKNNLRGYTLPTLLLTDGNQTKGVDVAYLRTKNPTYPVVFGDTTLYDDLYFYQINNNPYSFLDNNFPVEFFVNYKGNQPVETMLSVFKKGKQIFQQKIEFKEGEHSKKINCQIKSQKVGHQVYTVSIVPLKKERNKINNKSKFSVEIVDQSSKILLFSSFLHPDLGCLKQSIESNKQREVDVKIIDGKQIDVNKYQLVILYQPTADMRFVITQLKSAKIPYWIISGIQTDWQFLNDNQNIYSKEISKITEQFQAGNNHDFSLFQIKDFTGTSLPPLTDYFGDLNVKVKHDILFHRKFNHIDLNSPLFVFAEDGAVKTALLSGEGLWKWRLFDFKENDSFERFDNFIDVLVQYLSANSQADRLKLNYVKTINITQSPKITVNFFNESFQNQDNVSLNFKLFNAKGKVVKTSRLSYVEGYYEVSLDPLPEGDYSFTIFQAETNLKKSGYFSVVKQSLEQQNQSSNYISLKYLAQNTGGQINIFSKLDDTLELIEQDQHYKKVLKEYKNNQSLINWRWLLVLLIVSLTIEWVIRKYRGLV